MGDAGGSNGASETRDPVPGFDQPPNGGQADEAVSAKHEDPHVNCPTDRRSVPTKAVPGQQGNSVSLRRRVWEKPGLEKEVDGLSPHGLTSFDPPDDRPAHDPR